MLRNLGPLTSRIVLYSIILVLVSLNLYQVFSIKPILSTKVITLVRTIRVKDTQVIQRKIVENKKKGTVVTTEKVISEKITEDTNKSEKITSSPVLPLPKYSLSVHINSLKVVDVKGDVRLGGTPLFLSLGSTIERSPTFTVGLRVEF